MLENILLQRTQWEQEPRNKGLVLKKKITGINPVDISSTEWVINTMLSKGRNYQVGVFVFKYLAFL